MPNRRMQSIWGFPAAAMLLLAACGDPSVDGPESVNPDAIARGIAQKEKTPVFLPAAQPTESEKQGAEIQEELPPDPAKEESPKETGFEEVEWGREISLAEMITMAKGGEIREIQWHVMPNILRAQAFDNRIFHLRNENKGVDLRNMLIREGVRIGNGGIAFRHVF